MNKILVILIIFTTTSIFCADKECSVTLKRKNFQPDMELTQELIHSGEKSPTQMAKEATEFMEIFTLNNLVKKNIESWQDCYQVALKYISQKAYSKVYTYKQCIAYGMGWGCTQYQYACGIGKLYVDWSYDENGFVIGRSKPTGSVSKYSPEAPARGDSRLGPDASSFDDTL